MNPLRQPCPPNAIPYGNASLCSCEPGRYLVNGTCQLFTLPPGGGWVSYSTLGKEPTFLSTIIPFDTIKRFTQSQSIFLFVTAVALLVWLVFCGVVRLGKLRGGKSIWFRIRWWISRMDVCFATSHYVEEFKAVEKRRTELGGVCSIASWILFVGLFSALLYQTITKRSFEVHKVRPSNSPDLLSFINDVELNVTTISSMTCSQLRGLETLISGTPGSIDFRISALSTYAQYICQNTSNGPTVSIKCTKCHVPRGSFYISWQFIDLPNSPATAVAFQFSLLTKDHQNDKRRSFVGGIVNSASYADAMPKTFRGQDVNVLKIHLFPQIYHNLQNLSIIQPLFHDFIPGSFFTDTTKLQASLGSSADSVVNITLFVRFLSDYIVEVNNESILGPVSFLAELGGLYSISIAIFLYFLFQCENRIKKVRHEEKVLLNIRSQLRAQRNWSKLRKYVMYTWGPSNLDGKGISNPGRLGFGAGNSLHGVGYHGKSRIQRRKDTISFDKTAHSHVEMRTMAEESTVDKFSCSSNH